MSSMTTMAATATAIALHDTPTSSFNNNNSKLLDLPRLLILFARYGRQSRSNFAVSTVNEGHPQCSESALRRWRLAVERQATPLGATAATAAIAAVRC